MRWNVEDSGAAGVGQVADSSADSGCLVNTTISRGFEVSLKSVHMCESGSHSIVLRNRITGKMMICPFRCRSWRHAGQCQHFKGAQDFVRVSDGIASRGDRWVYVVLTFNQRAELSEWDCYRSGVDRWDKLRKRLEYHHGKLEYVQTWEKHTKSGFPHVNVVIHNSSIWDACAGTGWQVWRQTLKAHAVACGFGTIAPWVEPLRKDTGKGLAGYLTKLSRELTGAGVKNQIPVNAPPHFRRIRASRRLLPPVHRPGTHEALMLPNRAFTAVDLTPDGWSALIAARVAQAEGKKHPSSGRLPVSTA